MEDVWTEKCHLAISTDMKIEENQSYMPHLIAHHHHLGYVQTRLVHQGGSLENPREEIVVSHYRGGRQEEAGHAVCEARCVIVVNSILL